MNVIAAACDVHSTEPPRRALSENGAAKALRWQCLAPYTQPGFGCITLALDCVDGAVTDWTGTREIWLLVDASTYDAQPTPFMFFFRSHVNWELREKNALAYLYDLNTGVWQTAPTDWYALMLPAGFHGWIRMPLGRETFATPYWETPTPFDALRLDRVDMLSFGLAQRPSSVDASADFERFVLRSAPWHAACGLPAEGGDWQDILLVDHLPANVRLGESDDVQRIGLDNNFLAGISFSSQVVEMPTEYLLLLAHVPLLLRLDGRCCVLPGGHLLLCAAADAQYLQSQGPPLVYDVVRLSLTQEDCTWLAQQGIPLGEAISVKPLTAVREWLRCMARGFETRPPGWLAAVNACLHGLLFVIGQSLPRPAMRGAGRYDPALYLLRYRVYEQRTEAPSVTEVAEELHLSVSGVQHAYKRLFGCSYTADVIESRMQQARWLLAETDEPVAEVAVLCGYETLSHFMRQFKQRTGLTPGAYRRQTRTAAQT